MDVTAYAGNSHGVTASPLQADVVSEGGDVEAVTQSAPVREGAYFVVPKVLDH